MPKFDRLAWVQFNLDRIFVGLENNRMDPRETRGQERQETCGHTEEDPSKPETCGQEGSKKSPGQNHSGWIFFS